MRIQLSVQFYLKDRPKGYLGVTSESWNFGKNEPATMAELAIGFLTFLFSLAYNLPKRRGHQQRERQDPRVVEPDHLRGNPGGRQ